MSGFRLMPVTLSPGISADAIASPAPAGTFKTETSAAQHMPQAMAVQQPAPWPMPWQGCGASGMATMPSSIDVPGVAAGVSTPFGAW